MEKISGHVSIKGTVAYVTQSAWIQNMTLRDNILFGKAYDEERYLNVLEACALKRDLEILPDGDQTEIGEKGVNLSGGQKTRVTLARAVYADADVIVLDDPLAAVDAHVGRHIFRHVVGPHGMLQGKTRLFVTNAINWLAQCDTVVYIEQGRISEMGSYEELVDRDERFGDYLRKSAVDVEQQEADQGDESSDGSPRTSQPVSYNKGEEHLLQITIPKTPLQSVREGGKLIRSEEAREGGIKWATYKAIAKDMSYVMVAILAVCFTAAGLFSLGSNIWVGEWTKLNKTLPDGSIEQSHKSYGLGILALLVFLQLTFVAIALWGVSYGFVKAGRELHNGMLSRLMHSPMSYFDTTPLGRILNRFSKEIDTVDIALPRNTRYFCNAFFLGVTLVLQIMIALPLIAAIVIPLLAAIYFVKRYYQMTAMQLKRLDGLTRAPLISSLQQSFAGTAVILATGQTARFIAESHRKVDSLSSILHLSNALLQYVQQFALPVLTNCSSIPCFALRSWLCLSNLLIANTLTTIVSFTCVILRNTAAFPNEPAVVGLALMSAVAVRVIFDDG
ncbi:hypothetical protein RvY_03999-2 [Ramazzottius varieornatus]|uniref:ABC transmembrane type-1 domain-containing protein n=1 Tax=Ramazzottius varieornatus TaxID=947166 RepID=A0A1D1UQT1_RAMVA|nr:hypothetical protein RvY_03999-2 [Ramazzottius varieornatus]